MAHRVSNEQEGQELECSGRPYKDFLLVEKGLQARRLNAEKSSWMIPSACESRCALDTSQLTKSTDTYYNQSLTFNSCILSNTSLVDLVLFWRTVSGQHMGQHLVLSLALPSPFSSLPLVKPPDVQTENEVLDPCHFCSRKKRNH